MGKRAIRLLLGMLVMLSIFWGTDIGSGRGLPGGRRPAYAPGELLVKYKPAVGTLAAAHFERQWGVATVRTFQDIGVQHVKLPTDLAVEEALDLYRNDPDVEYVEPNYYRYLTATPNDTSFGLLWGLSTISAPEAWDLRTDCAAAVVAVIDSGVDFQHLDIAANVWSNPAEVASDGIDNDGNGYVDDVMGWDFVDGDALPMDSNNHGTHVAGTIAAVGNNARGVAGVCWTGKLMVLRAFDAFGLATSSDLIDAMAYARSNGARVINASYGSAPGDPLSQAEQDELSLCNTAGILFVAAAGNEANNNDSQRVFPASYDLPNIIAAAATNQNDNRASFSNYGQSSVHVAAPGVNIYSTKPGRQTLFSDNFDDGDISDWTVDPPWGLSSSGSFTPSFSLTDSPTGNYANSINVSARPTNPINLSDKTGTVLSFKLKGTILAGDALYIETSPDGANWTSRLGLFGDSGEWVDLVVDLGSLDGTATAYFRFRLQTDGSGTADGVYIDDVEVTASAVQDTYQFLQGTSMATPHVTGLAALVWAHTPALTHLQVKERILNCVDRLTALATTTPVLTQGRINASNSIRNLPAPPVGLSATAASSSRINLKWANTYYGQIGFKIERKEGASGTFAEIANLSTNTTSYNDAGLTSSTAYTYRVRAYTSDNDSAYSSEVTATTPAPSSGGGGGGGGGCFIDTALGK